MRGILWTGTLAVRDDIELVDEAPGPNEVLVRIQEVGLCHSDVSIMDGTIPYPTPVVLGHEGAGVVEAVGIGVRHVATGDHVVVTTLRNCGLCAACDSGRPTHCRETSGTVQQPYRVDGAPVYAFANAGVFVERTIVRASQAVRIDRRVPFGGAALLGCAFVTGAGAVLHRADVRPGDRVAVIGAGGVGLAVIQAARIASAGSILAVDVNPSKEGVARRLGATAFEVALPTHDRFDHVFECVGHPDLIRGGVGLLDTGGQLVLLGVPRLGTEASFVVQDLYQDKSILGCRYGSTRPHHDIPLLVDLYLDGRLLLDEMISATYDLGDLERAVADLRAGTLHRGVLRVAAAG